MRVSAVRSTARAIRLTLREHCKRCKTFLQNNEKTSSNEISFGCPVRIIDVYGARGYVCYYDMSEVHEKLAKFPITTEQIAYVNSVIKELTLIIEDNTLSNSRVDHNIIETFARHGYNQFPTLYINDILKAVQHEISSIYKRHLWCLIGACMAQDVAHINTLAHELLDEYNTRGEFSLDKACIYNGVISQLCERSMHNSMSTSALLKEEEESKVNNNCCCTITELIDGDCSDDDDDQKFISSNLNFHESSLTEQEHKNIYSNSDASALENARALEESATHIADEKNNVSGTIRNGNENVYNEKLNKENVEDGTRNDFKLALALAMNYKMPSLSVYTAKELVKMININSPDAITLLLDKMKLKDNKVAAFQSCATQLAIRIRKEKKLLLNKINSNEQHEYKHISGVVSAMNSTDHSVQEEKMTLVDSNLLLCQRYNIDPWLVYTTDAKAIWEWAKVNVLEQQSFSERALALLSIIQERRLLPGHLSVTTLSLYCMYDLQRKWWQIFLNEDRSNSVNSVAGVKHEQTSHIHKNNTSALDKKTDDNTKPTSEFCSLTPNIAKINENNIENEVWETVTQLALRDVQRNIIDTHQLRYYSELLRRNEIEVESTFHAFIEECGECYLTEERPSKLEFTLTNSLFASLHIPTQLDNNVAKSSGSMIASGKVLLSCNDATEISNMNVTRNSSATKIRSLSLSEMLRSLAPLSAYWCTLLDNFSHLFHVMVAPCSELRVHVNLPSEHECVKVARELYKQNTHVNVEEPERKELKETAPIHFDNEEQVKGQEVVNEECKSKKLQTEQRTLHYKSENNCEELNVQNGAESGNANNSSAELSSLKYAQSEREIKSFSRYKSLLPLRMLYEDADIFVLDKPANIATCHHALSCTQMHSTMTDIVSLLLTSPEYSFLSKVPRQGKVHRLDYETSGCLLFAKNEVAYDMLRHQMGTSASFSHYSKVYLALCIVLEDELTSIPLHGILTDPVEKRIISKYRIVEFFADARVVLVECRLQQGKKHQLRRHLAAAGLPIAGDVEHGGAVCCQPFINRVALHAQSLHFIHPQSGQPICVSSPMPLDFNLALDTLHHNYRNIVANSSNDDNHHHYYNGEKDSAQVP